MGEWPRFGQVHRIIFGFVVKVFKRSRRHKFFLKPGLFSLSFKTLIHKSLKRTITQAPIHFQENPESKHLLLQNSTRRNRNFLRKFKRTDPLLQMYSICLPVPSFTPAITLTITLLGNSSNDPSLHPLRTPLHGRQSINRKVSIWIIYLPSKKSLNTANAATENHLALSLSSFFNLISFLWKNFSNLSIAKYQLISSLEIPRESSSKLKYYKPHFPPEKSFPRKLENSLHRNFRRQDLEILYKLCSGWKINDRANSSKPTVSDPKLDRQSLSCRISKQPNKPNNTKHVLSGGFSQFFFGSLGEKIGAGAEKLCRVCFRFPTKEKQSWTET